MMKLIGLIKHKYIIFIQYFFNKKLLTVSSYYGATKMQAGVPTQTNYIRTASTSVA